MNLLWIIHLLKIMEYYNLNIRRLLDASLMQASNQDWSMGGSGLDQESRFPPLTRHHQDGQSILGEQQESYTQVYDSMWPHWQSWFNCCRSISNLIQMLLLSLSQIMENRDWSCWRRRRSLVLPWLLASGRMLLCGMILPATIPKNGSVRTVMSFSLKLD